MDTLNRTDIHGNPVVERRAWSFSALDKFTNCPRKFHVYDIAKIIKEPESPQMKEGFRVHKAMADFIAKDTPLPPEYSRYADWATTMKQGPPTQQVYVEHKLACTYQLKPCAYFSKTDKVWLRAQADVLILDGPVGRSIDWKTGSEKDPRYELLPPNFQLKLVALLTFLHFPKVQTLNNKYIYLNDGIATDFIVTRQQMADFLPQVYDLAGGLQKAVRNNDFPPRPSGLCKRHCGVTTCEYWGKGSY